MRKIEKQCEQLNENGKFSGYRTAHTVKNAFALLKHLRMVKERDINAI